MTADRFDRRALLATGVKAAGTFALAGGLPSLLAACGGSTTPAAGDGGGPVPVGPGTGISHLPPRRGGQVTIGTYSEMSGLAPTALTARFDATGFSYANAVYDPIAILAADGTVKPYLAESFTPNESYDTWTVKMRPGVVFHDGAACDAGAFMANLSALRGSIIAGPAFKPITGVSKMDELTVQIRLVGPWVAFPASFTSQAAYMISPNYINGDGSLHPDAPSKPIGTGPFVFQEWERYVRFTAVRNPHYWRHGLPYLDAIEFRPIPDDQSREATLRSGGINLLHSQNPATYFDLAGDPGFQVYNDVHGVVGEPTVDNLILNCQVGPTSDPRIRQALVFASNREAFRTDFFDGLPTLTSGLFAPGDPWFSPGLDIPHFDPARAHQLIKSYQADHPGPVNIEISGPSVTRYVEIMEAFQSMWKSVGIDVTINPMLQDAYTEYLVFGKYQVGLFEWFAAADPDENYTFFHSSSIGAPGAFSFNLARYSDPELDKFLETGRTNPDPHARIDAYQGVNRRLMAGLPYFLAWQTLWVAAADRTTMNFRGLTCPDGSLAYAFNAGSFYPAAIWVSR